jgi:uncharacterized membrane protein
MRDNETASGSRKATGATREIVIFLNKLILGFAKSWAAWIAGFMLLYSGLPFVAPIAMNFGWTPVGNTIYAVYGPLCHQFAFRSWFLFGDELTYPRELAHLNGPTFESIASQDPAFSGIDVTTLNPALIQAAKNFRGNERIGWKVAFCERDVAIYGSIALCALLFIVVSRTKFRVPYLPIWAYVLFGILPMLADGGSQYLGNLQFAGLDFGIVRESSPLLRVLTGALFGIANAWLAFPYLEVSMKDTRQLIEAKLTKAGILPPPTMT